MAKNHIKPNIIGLQCAVECLKPHLTSGTTETLVPNIPKNSGSTPTPCLDKAVLAHGGGGVRFFFSKEPNQKKSQEAQVQHH